MSFIYSQALVAASLPASCLDTEPSAPLSGSPTPRPCLWHDKTMEPSRLSRFGMTCKPLMDDHGAALLTSWLAGFHARTYPSPVVAQDLMASAAECGTTWPASLAKYDPASHSLKTAQLSFLEDLTGCSLTLPRWGLMRNGELYQQPMLARRTSESASGLWPTPNVPNGGRVMSKEMALNGGYTKDGKKRQIDLGSAVRHWPTPTVCGNNNYKGSSAKAGDGLATAVMKWPAPTAQDAEQAGGKGCIASGKRGLSLHQATQQFPTPVRSDYKSGSFSQEGRVKRDSHSRGKPLNETIGGQLNPDWVEWLMGWPIGHTALKPLATAKYQEWLQQHSICLEVFE